MSMPTTGILSLSRLAHFLDNHATHRLVGCQFLGRKEESFFPSPISLCLTACLINLADAIPKWALNVRLHTSQILTLGVHGACKDSLRT